MESFPRPRLPSPETSLDYTFSCHVKNGLAPDRLRDSGWEETPGESLECGAGCCALCVEEEASSVRHGGWGLMFVPFGQELRLGQGAG